jgi:death-on-curing protein
VTAGEPRWLERPLADAIHFDQVRMYGGNWGLREENLLESSLARAKNKWHYEPAADLATLGAAYGFSLAKNHPWVDGNKRAAFMVMYTFLAVNGRRLVAPEPEAVITMLAVAAGDMSEERLAEWVRAHLVTQALEGTP